MRQHKKILITENPKGNLMTDIKKIREAIIANRGGLETASDGEIMSLWTQLDEKTQRQYLERIKPAPAKKGAENAEKM